MGKLKKLFRPENKLLFVLLLFSFSNIYSSKYLQANSKGIDPPPKKKIALIIGNADYEGARLRNPVHDAKSIEDQLKDVGFEVRRLENSSLREMSDETREFGRKLRQADVALYYYSGHGIQYNNTNWLLPVEADIRREQDLEFEAYNLNRLLTEMEGGTKNRVNIVIVDACRTPPVFRNFRSTTNGLTTPSRQPKGTIIAFSTAPGTVAHDGDGNNSPYVAELIKYIKTAGMKIEDMFKQVRKGVVERTSKMSHPQVPWENSSLVGDFYFVEKEIADEDIIRWAEIRNSNDKREFESFVNNFPDSIHREDAIYEINKLDREKKHKLDRERKNNQSTDEFYDISFRTFFGAYNIIEMKVSENLGAGLFHELVNYEDEDTQIHEAGYSISLISFAWLDSFKQLYDLCYACDGPFLGASFGNGRIDFSSVKGSKVETGVTVFGLGAFYQWIWPSRFSFVLGASNVIRNFSVLNESYVSDETTDAKNYINRRVKARSDFLPLILFGYSF